MKLGPDITLSQLIELKNGHLANNHFQVNLPLSGGGELMPRRTAQYDSELYSLQRKFDGLLCVILERLPRELRSASFGLGEAENSEAFREAKYSFSAMCIEESRKSIEKTNSDWGYAQERCDCVLCRSSAAAKRGIEKHLYPGAGADCPVMAAIIYSAQRDFEESAARQVEIEAERAAEVERLGVVYLTDISLPAEPRRRYFQTFERSDEDLAKVEERLKVMGFVRVESPIRKGVTEIRWEMHTETAYVLADPFPQKSVRIRAWPRGTENTLKPNRRHSNTPYESISDNTKHDLSGKVMARANRLVAIQK